MTRLGPVVTAFKNFLKPNSYAVSTVRSTYFSASVSVLSIAYFCNGQYEYGGRKILTDWFSLCFRIRILGTAPYAVSAFRIRIRMLGPFPYSVFRIRIPYPYFGASSVFRILGPTPYSVSAFCIRILGCRVLLIELCHIRRGPVNVPQQDSSGGCTF